MKTVLAAMTSVLVLTLAVVTPSQGGRVAAISGSAVRCPAKAFVADLSPTGSVKMLEYDLGKPIPNAPPTPKPTGRVLAYIDASFRRLNSSCKKIGAIKSKADVLVGPYSRSQESKVFCDDSPVPFDGRYVQFEVRPVLNRSKRPIGNEVVGTVNSLKVVDATITRGGGGIRFDPFKCVRNSPYIK